MSIELNRRHTVRDQLGEEKAARKYLHKLFPSGYGPELCKIAAMTMPRKVMLYV
jgi:sulfur relay (sulfurtransferase) DsrC/TusE family protein